MTGVEPGPRGQDAAAVVIQGDVNCDTTVNAVDSLQILRSVAGLSTSAGCLTDRGDVNCDSAINAVDALRILRYVAGLTNTTADGCPPIGEELGPLSPQALAARLHAATDIAQVEALLRRVYPELGVGVYTADGEQLLGGAERGPEDFYMYDVEFELLASAYLEEQTFSVEALAAFLEEAGVVRLANQQPLTASDLLSLLSAGIQRSRAEDSLFTLRVVDELGLVRVQPLDLTAEALDPATTFLDPVQYFLLAYDVLTGLPENASPDTYGAYPNAAPCDFSGDNSKSRASGILDEAAELGIRLDPTETTLQDALLRMGFRVRWDSAPARIHWRHAEGDPGAYFILILEFRLGQKIRDAIARPCAEALARAARNLPHEGFVADARAEWGNSPSISRNGSWLYSAYTRTNTEGKAQNSFVPKLESQPAQGQVVEEKYWVNVVFTPPYPNNRPISSVREFVIERHTTCPTAASSTAAGVAPAAGAAPLVGSGAASAGSAPALEAATDAETSQAQPGQSVSIEAITSLDQLPCTWTGTAHGSIHHYISGYYDEVGEIDGTFTFGNAQLDGDFVTYEIISGSATWHASGHVGDCSFSKSGTEEVEGSLDVYDDGSGQLTYTGGGGTVGQNRETGCEPPIILETVWFFDTCPLLSWPLTGLDVSGSCNSDHPTFWHDEYDWHLTAGSCSAAAVTPEGVCGGP